MLFKLAESRLRWSSSRFKCIHHLHRRLSSRSPESFTQPIMFARSAAVRSVARQGRHFSSTSAARATAQENASSAINDISKKAQEIGGPVIKRVEGLLGGM